MEKISIDISVFAAGKAFGRISGIVESAVIPSVGDIISFAITKTNIEVELDDGRLVFDQLMVKAKILSVNSVQEPIYISLEDISVLTTEDAYKVAKFYEIAHGLFFENY